MEATVPAELRFIIDLGFLAVGFGLVLWGLRIFKAYVLLVGLLVGAGLGGAIGSVAINGDNGLLIGALGGGFIGAIAAWPLQRIIAFLMAGAATGLVVSLATGAVPGSEAFGPAFAIGFLIGGFLGLIIFERIVIAALAFTGAQAIFLAAFVPNEVYNPNSFTAIADGILGVYESRMAAFAITTITCIGLALWYQRSGRNATPLQARARSLRRVPVGFAILILFANIAVGLGAFAFGWETSSFALTGLHPLAWAFTSMMTVVFLGARSRFLAPQESPTGAEIRPRRKGTAYPVYLLGSVAALPLATGFVFRSAGSPTWGLGAFFGAFIDAAPPVLAFKWFAALIWLPFVMWRAMPRALVVEPVATTADQDQTEVDDPATAEDVVMGEERAAQRTPAPPIAATADAVA
jgi:hypothetical protein